MKMDYDKSVELALALGFIRFEDETAFNGECFIKNNKKWIHWIDRLKRKLNVTDDRELIEHGYDLHSYCKYRDYTNTMVNEEIKRILIEIENPNSVLYGKVEILQNKENLDTHTSLVEEGFDNEILADFHHQISKR